jgi:hypothetical protein
MEWTAESMDRLYGLYERYIDRLLSDIMAVNRSLGSRTPSKTNLRQLTRVEFEELLKRPPADALPTILWVKRIIRGHERDFPEFDASNGSNSATCADARLPFTHSAQRRTGT